jgi:hypothetical protein
MMDDIKHSIKVWLNECLLHTKTEDNLLAILNFFFKQCQMYRMNLHARKSVLFATMVKYCGRLITKEELRFDSKDMKAPQTMREPQNGTDLVQYFAAVNWMRSAIPNYSKRVAPLQAALANCSRVKAAELRICSRSVAAISLGTRGASSFQRFASSYHGVNDVGILRPRQEDLCLDGCLRSLLCWLGDTDRRGAAGSSDGRARPSASCVL